MVGDVQSSLAWCKRTTTLPLKVYESRSLVEERCCSRDVSCCCLCLHRLGSPISCNDGPGGQCPSALGSGSVHGDGVAIHFLF